MIVPRKAKANVWGCLICKSLKNRSEEKKCPYCGAKRESCRFALSCRGILFLCYVHTARTPPLVTITRLSPPEAVTVKLPQVHDSLLEAVKEALERETLPASSSLLRSSSCEEKESPGEEEKDKRLDLFHKVLDDGKGLTYDSHLASFVPVGRKESSDLFSSEGLTYAASMKKEKEALNKVVQDTLSSRKNPQIDNHSVDINQDCLKEWRGKIPCALCGVYFPCAQLLGNISNQSVLKWLRAHDAPCDSKECKRMALQSYETAKLCLFCAQFFDNNTSNGFDIEKAANVILSSNKVPYTRKKPNKENVVIENLKEKLAIVELKQKKDSHFSKNLKRTSADEVVHDAEKILQLSKQDTRHLKFTEAREKFKRHKMNLAEKETRSQSAKKMSPKSGVKIEKIGLNNTRKTLSTSRSAPTIEKKPYSTSNAKKKNVPNNNVSDKKGSKLPQLVQKSSKPGPNSNERENGTKNIDNDDKNKAKSSPTKKNKKKRAPKSVNRLTKKEAARLELLKEAKVKQLKNNDKKFKSLREQQESNWTHVSVGRGAEEKDLQVFRMSRTQRIAALRQEYEEDARKQQSSLDVLSPAENDDHDSNVIGEDEKVSPTNRDVRRLPADDDCLNLKPSISLELLQHHRQKLQAMHLKHLESHIDSQNKQPLTSPDKKPSRIITKEMIENHKKHVLSQGSAMSSDAKSENCTSVSDKSKLKAKRRPKNLDTNSSGLKKPAAAFNIKPKKKINLEDMDELDRHDGLDSNASIGKNKGHNLGDDDEGSLQNYSMDDFDMETQVMDEVAESPVLAHVTAINEDPEETGNVVEEVLAMLRCDGATSKVGEHCMDDEIKFEPEIDTPWDCDPELDEDIPSRNSRSPSTPGSARGTPCSTPWSGSWRRGEAKSPLKRYISTHDSEVVQGIELLRGSSRVGAVSQSGRRSSRSRRLEQFDNSHPSSRPLRPISRSSGASAGGSRRARNRLDPYDNSTFRSPMPKNDNALVMSPGVRSRQREGMNRLEVLGPFNAESTTDTAAKDMAGKDKGIIATKRRSKITADNAPSQLELRVMKFNGEVKMKRLDSFEKLSKKIQESTSPTKLRRKTLLQK